MTRTVDDATAVKIGKLVGLEAIIFGSIMKVGSSITISGRVINAETSEVIAAGSVEFSSLISRQRFGLRLGTGMSLNTLDLFSTLAYSPLAVGAYYQSRYIDGELYASPLTGATTISVLFSVNPFVHFGFGVGFEFTSDGSAGEAAKNAYYGNYQAVLLGVTYRASDMLRAALYVGAAFMGYVKYWPKDPTYTAMEYYYKSTLSLGAAAFTMELRFNEAFSLMLALYNNGGDAVIDHKLAEDPTQPNTYGNSVSMNTLVLSLMIGYSFSF